MDIYPGQIVYSMAGRDKGKYFIVIEKIDENYVYLCDGDLRKIEKPKKKKIKHIRLTGKVDRTIGEKLIAKQKVSNSEIRKSLKAMLEEVE
ncbi:MAG: RNA-binding protein [Clostridiaceae bacterium]|nr:RNA-binding protein [Clostridiaceae bacterium]